MSQIDNTNSIHSASHDETETRKIGVHGAVELSFKLVEKNATLSEIKKRQLVYSLYCFRCLFDDELIKNPPAVLKAFNLVKGVNMPLKLDLYNLVYAVVSLKGASDILKAHWYASFAYCLLLEPPHESDVYVKVQKILTTDKVFKAVLYSDFSLYIRDSVEELEARDDMPHILINWYTPYIEYKHYRDSDDKTREEIKFLEWLKQGKFKQVYLGTEKLLDSLIDDDGILICNIASRVSLDGVLEEADRMALLNQTLALIESALERGSPKGMFLHYYAAIIHIAFKNNEAAKANLAACLELNPNFVLAQNMMKLIK